MLIYLSITGENTSEMSVGYKMKHATGDSGDEPYILRRRGKHTLQRPKMVDIVQNK